MNSLPALVGAVGGYVARVLDLMPFPQRVRGWLRSMNRALAGINPYAPLVAAVVVTFLTVRLVLWLFRLPLIYAWQVFGFISGNNVIVLSWYNILAHAVALLVAAKLVYELTQEDQ